PAALPFGVPVAPKMAAPDDGNDPRPPGRKGDINGDRGRMNLRTIASTGRVEAAPVDHTFDERGV
ncbi:MAG TPA: hypothetical protein VMY42_03625, partial [Thermoguttaceae bacterium]|nr:hypothetical protein [Thermoguttaceae bacterium]